MLRRIALLCCLAAPAVFAADYHVDPVQGSMANSGTALLPWSTLEAVFAAGKSFQPGDRLFLRRGYHGTLTVSGINTGDVLVVAEPGHTPAVHISLLNAHHWYFKGLTLLSTVDIDNQTNENSDYNTFEDCYLPNGGFAVYGNYITLRGNHIRNGGIHFGYHSNYGLISRNVIEDFYSDAMNQKGNYGVWEYNLVMNAHKVSANHNDMFQGWASKGNVLRGNEFRAYSDPNQPDLYAPGLSDVQGIGCFDGWYEDWVIENNVLFVDHAIGIWIAGAKRCRVNNNTVVRCGQSAFFSSRFPSIAIDSKKSSDAAVPGAPSVNNSVINNLAERFELTTNYNSGVSMGTNLANSVVAKSAFGNTFLNWSRKDLRLKAGASSLIDSGTSSNAPPATDADANPRPNGAGWDRGAYEYGYTTAADVTPPTAPAGVAAVIVSGYGVDLRWNASSDGRGVTGYDVYRNGALVGRTRAGTNYLDISTNTTGTYTIKAFDRSDNVSVASEPVGGAVAVPDTNAPSIPADLAATALSSSSLLVTWCASTDNVAVAGYTLYRDGINIATTAGTNWTDSGLAPSASFPYTVTAFDAAGNASPASAPAVGATLAVDTEPPAIPQGLSAAVLSSSAIQLRWSASTDNRGVAGYTVFRNGDAVDSVAGTNYNDAGLAAATLYTYSVKAFDAEGNESGASDLASATTREGDPVLAYEPFDYAASTNLNGLSGGIGWGGPWVVGCNAAFPATIQTGSLGSVTGLVSSGNSLRFWAIGNGSVYENLDRPFDRMIADGGQTNWLAMVIALYDAKNAATWTLTGLKSDAGGTNAANLFDLQGGIPSALKFGTATLFAGSTNYTPHLVLVKMAMSGDEGAETFTAYVDPDLSSDPSSWTGAVRSVYANDGLVGLAYRGGRASSASFDADVYMDEIRIAGSWQAAVGMTAEPADTEPPSVPQTLEATALSASSIGLTWGASTDNVAVAGYTVWREGTNIAFTAATYFTDAGLLPATTYRYAVRALDTTGNVSAASATATATTLALPPVLAGESFDYAATNLVGLAGGTGWTGGWIIDSHYDYEVGRFEVPDGTLSNYPGLSLAGRYGSFLSGGSGTYYPSAQRNLTTALADDGGTYWLAFLLQVPGYHKNSSYSLLGSSLPLIELKSDVTGMDFRFLGGTYYSPGDAGAHLFLIRIQMSGDTNAESASLFYDPDLSAGPDGWTALRTGAFAMTNGLLTAFRSDSARAGNTGYRAYIDEIRLAATWQAAVGQSSGSQDANGNEMPDLWEQIHFGSLTNDQGAAGADWDGDRISNLEEYRAGTDPTNPASLLALFAADFEGGTNLVLQWYSVADKVYSIERSTNLFGGFRDTPYTNVLATGGFMSRTVTVDEVDGFYRIKVLP